MMVQIMPQIKSPWLGATVALILIWMLWSSNLHPHFATSSLSRHSHSNFKSAVPEWKEALILGDGNIGAATSSIQPKSTQSSISTTTSALHAIPSPVETPKSSDRPLILYAFFETELSRKNLEFFIKHALHDAADFLFVINGKTDVERLLPDKPNIRSIRRKNDCYDMGAFAEVLIKDDLYKKYNRFITMNASIRGPFFPIWSISCWSDMYLNRITDEVKLVGMTLGCRPHAHVQSMIWATDRIGIETLLFPSESLIQKFSSSLPPHDDTNPVPPWETAGINSCPHEYWKAVAIEVFATPLIRAAGYRTDVLMSAYHSIPDYEVACRDWLDGDVLSHGHYYGMDMHPFDTIFAKTNRGNDPLVLDKMTEWTDSRNYTSYDDCH